MNEYCSKCDKLIDGSSPFFHYTHSDYWLCEECMKKVGEDHIVDADKKIENV